MMCVLLIYSFILTYSGTKERKRKRLNEGYKRKEKIKDKRR